MSGVLGCGQRVLVALLAAYALAACTDFGTVGESRAASMVGAGSGGSPDDGGGSTGDAGREPTDVADSGPADAGENEIDCSPVAGEPFCQPCTVDADCGQEDGLHCYEKWGALLCLECDQDSDCPSGDECEHGKCGGD